MQQPKTPVVMTFSSNDPTGGSGIQADIETLFSLGCHCTPIITAITAADTCGLKDYKPIPASLVIEQARVVLEDIPIAAFKIGMLGSVENCVAIHTILTDYPHIPVIFNPPLSAVGRTNHTDAKLIAAIASLLCPLTTFITHDNLTAQILVPEANNLADCGLKLMQLGCKFVLITGTHSATPNINTLFFGENKLLETFSWERLPTRYHGCSCTLSASIAAFIARQLTPAEAVRQGQEYTLECLKQGYRIGMGMPLPRRLYRPQKACSG